MQARTGRVSVPSMNPAAHTETPIRERADHRGDHAGARSPQRRRRGRLTSVLLALGSVALLAGCATASAAPTPTPTTTSLIAGLFATEDEALEAAKKLYLRYAVLSEQLGEFPHSNSSELEAIISPDLYKGELENAAALASVGMIVRGTVSYYGFRYFAAQGSNVVFTMCADVSGFRLLNSSGEDVTDDSDESQVPLKGVIDFSSSPVLVALDPGLEESCAG